MAKNDNLMHYQLWSDKNQTVCGLDVINQDTTYKLENVSCGECKIGVLLRQETTPIFDSVVAELGEPNGVA